MEIDDEQIATFEMKPSNHWGPCKLYMATLGYFIKKQAI